MGISKEPFPPDPPLKVYEWQVDLEGDGEIELVTFVPRTENALSVHRNGRLLWRGVPKRWNAWKLEIGDVDGDGIRELVLGVYKPTRFYPVYGNGLFILGWNGQYAYSKWLGSRLVRPFVDFALLSLDDQPAMEVASLEILRDERYCLTLYQWSSFGLQSIWQSPPLPQKSTLIRLENTVGVCLPNRKTLRCVYRNRTYALEPL